MRNSRLFGLAALIGFAAALGLSVANAPDDRRRAGPVASPAEQAALAIPAKFRLSETIAVHEQMHPADLSLAEEAGYRTVIDLRPDGEVAGQPAAETMAAAAKAIGLTFAYVPVPRGDIPDETVAALAKVLNDAPGPVLLYCRSGSRAARTWALAEASRADGAPSDQIAARIRTAGFEIDDIRPALDRRAAARITKG